MVNEERPIEGFDELRAPPLSPERRRRLRDAILARAELALARRRRAPSYWDVLAAWARPGLVAAAIVLLVLAAALPWAGPGDAPLTGPVALDDALRLTGDDEPVPAVLLTSSEPDRDAVAAAALSREVRAESRRD